MRRILTGERDYLARNEGASVVAPRSLSAVIAVVGLLLAGGCAEGADPDSRSDAPTVSTPEGSASSKPPSTKLVVLGDSNAHVTGCYPGCKIFPEQVAQAMSDKLGSEVEVVNLAWALDNPRPARVGDIEYYVRNDSAARDELRAADAVIIFVSQNDLPYGRGDDPCRVAPHFPRIRWAELTHECMDAAIAEYESDLDALLSEIDGLRAGRATMLRVVTAVNTAPGDLVDPTWNSPAAIEPSTYSVERMATVQCRLAKRHGGKCADVFHVLNGPGGRRSAQRFLNPNDATHLWDKGHDAVADTVIALGFEPLTR
jgi:GDSL-like Lipase/Acylhydrolase family